MIRLLKLEIYFHTSKFYITNSQIPNTQSVSNINELENLPYSDISSMWFINDRYTHIWTFVLTFICSVITFTDKTWFKHTTDMKY